MHKRYLCVLSFSKNYKSEYMLDLQVLKKASLPIVGVGKDMRLVRDELFGEYPDEQAYRLATDNVLDCTGKNSTAMKYSCVNQFEQAQDTLYGISRGSRVGKQSRSFSYSVHVYVHGDTKNIYLPRLALLLFCISFAKIN